MTLPTTGMNSAGVSAAQTRPPGLGPSHQRDSVHSVAPSRPLYWPGSEPLGSYRALSADVLGD